MPEITMCPGLEGEGGAQERIRPTWVLRSTKMEPGGSLEGSYSSHLPT